VLAHRPPHMTGTRLRTRSPWQKDEGPNLWVVVWATQKNDHPTGPDSNPATAAPRNAPSGVGAANTRTG
jgi:hypothetical protein